MVKVASLAFLLLVCLSGIGLTVFVGSSSPAPPVCTIAHPEVEGVSIKIFEDGLQLCATVDLSHCEEFIPTWPGEETDHAYVIAVACEDFAERFGFEPTSTTTVPPTPVSGCSTAADCLPCVPGGTCTGPL